MRLRRAWIGVVVMVCLAWAQGADGSDPIREAQAAAAGGDLDRALKLLDSAIEKSPNDPLLGFPIPVDLLTAKGMILLNANRPEEALKSIGLARRRAPEDVELIRMEVQGWRASGHLRRAILTLKHATDNPLPDAGLLLEYGMLCLEDSQPIRAEGIFVRASEAKKGIEPLMGLLIARAASDNDGVLALCRDMAAVNDPALKQNLVGNLTPLAKRYPNNYTVRACLSVLNGEAPPEDTPAASRLRELRRLVKRAMVTLGCSEPYFKAANEKRGALIKSLKMSLVEEDGVKVLLIRLSAEVDPKPEAGKANRRDAEEPDYESTLGAVAAIFMECESQRAGKFPDARGIRLEAETGQYKFRVERSGKGIRFVQTGAISEQQIVDRRIGLNGMPLQADDTE